MTLADLDRELAQFWSAAQTISANLIALEQDPNRQLLEIAAGPSLDRLSGGSAGVSVGGASASAFSGMYFALHGRVALHNGGKPNTTTGRRTSFTIGADVHPTFAEGNTLTFYTVGLGADWY